MGGIGEGGGGFRVVGLRRGSCLGFWAEVRGWRGVGWRGVGTLWDGE